MADRPPIPAAIVSRILLVSKLTDHEQEALAGTLDGKIFYSNRQDLAAAVAGAVGDDAERGSELVELVLGFAQASVESTGAGPERSVSEGLVGDLPEPPAADARNILIERLQSLFNAPAVLLFASSRSLARAHSRLWLNGAITPEVRPVFSGAGSESLSAIVPWHLLRVEFADDLQIEESKYAEFALDHRDLISLKDQIDKALKRQSAIQAAMLGLGIPTWDPVESAGDKEGQDDQSDS